MLDWYFRCVPTPCVLVVRILLHQGRRNPLPYGCLLLSELRVPCSLNDPLSVLPHVLPHVLQMQAATVEEDPAAECDDYLNALETELKSIVKLPLVSSVRLYPENGKVLKLNDAGIQLHLKSEFVTAKVTDTKSTSARSRCAAPLMLYRSR